MTKKLTMHMNNNQNKFAAAVWLESMLGATENPDNLFSFANIIKLDESEVFPESQAEYLRKIELQHFYVPAKMGGKLGNFDEFVYLFRSLYRRDPTLGLGFGATTFIASIPVFVSGNAALQNRVSELIRQGNTIAVAYHEQEHGNDLLSNEVVVALDADIALVSGCKWVVNNIETSHAITVFAKSSLKGGSRGYSLLLIDKSSAIAASIAYFSKIKTLGVRGCRISAVEFNNTPVAHDYIIGDVGQGLELTFKAFQITRATLPGMSLGAGDTALRCVVDFANQRRLYDKQLIELPHVYETLVKSFIQLLICDALSITAARSLHCIPEQMSVIAALTKFYIPKVIQNILQELSVILGARHYIREDQYPIFQKIIRDYPVVSVGHSSDVICVNTILPQLKKLLHSSCLTENTANKLQTIFNIGEELPAFNADLLKISNHGYNDIFNSLTLLNKKLDLITNDEVENTVIDNIRNRLEQINLTAQQLKANVNDCNSQISDFSQRDYNIVEEYINLFVAITCVWMWISNLNSQSSYFNSGHWIVLALNNIFDQEVDLELQRQCITISLQQLQQLHITKHSFSLFPIQYQ